LIGEPAKHSHASERANDLCCLPANTATSLPPNNGAADNTAHEQTFPNNPV
jgi:hypothetical protein